MESTKKKRSILAFFTKFIVSFCIFIAVSLVLICFVLPYFIPVEKVVKIEMVNEALAQQTGLKLELNGKTRISILPFLGIKAYNIAVKNITKEFAEHSSVLNAKKIDIKLAVFPLLYGNIVIKNILFEGANIDIFKCGNAMNVFSPMKIAEVQQKQPEESEAKFQLQNYIKSFGIAKFIIKQSNFSYAECNTSTNYVIKNFDASLAVPSFKDNFAANIGMILNGNKILIDIKSSSLEGILQNHNGNLQANITGDFGTIALNAKYYFDTVFQTFFDKTTLSIKGENISLEKLAQMLNVKAQSAALSSLLSFSIETKIGSNNIMVDELTLQMGGLSGKGQGIDISIPSRKNINTISAKGNVSVNVANVESFVSAKGESASIVKKYPENIGLYLAFSLANSVLKLDEKSNLTIDQDTAINISGMADVLGKAKSVIFSVHSKIINLDTYLNLASKAKEKQESNNEKYIPILQKMSDKDIALPTIGGIIVDGSLEIEKLIARGIIVEKLESKLKVRNGELANRLSFKAFDGTALLETKVVEKANKLNGLGVLLTLKSFEIQRIIEIFNLPKFAEGKIDTNLTFNANAANARAVLTHGKGEIEVSSNTITAIGVDLDGLATDISADYKKLLSSDAVKKYISPEKKTSLDNFTMQANISGGIINNTKLNATKNSITLNGFGTVNLNDEKIDYTVLPKNNSQTLPALVIKGVISDPSYSVDPSAYIKDQVKNTVQEQIKTNPAIQEKISQINDVINNFKL